MSTLAQSQQITPTSSEMTTEQLLKEKFGNFVKWLEEREAHYPKIAALKGRFTPFLEPDGIVKFALFVKQNLKPFAHELDQFVSAILVAHGISRSDISAEDFDKLNRYLGLFCKLV